MRSGDAIEALKEASLIEEKELSSNWHTAIREQYARVMQATARAHTFGRPLIANDAAKRTTDVSPAISPDGRHIVYFSARDVFSIDLYLADVATGRIVRKLVDTALNSHFTSLQFIGSVGSWSPNSRQFVIGGVRAGKAVLAILNVSDGDVAREIEVPEVGEILNPTWSPDHKSIAFSATVGGDSDLFILDVASGTTRRVTSDLFADLQPAWSPDGDRIVFVTDRFTTNAELLRAGDYRLALYDVATGNVTPLSTFAEGKNINPQWSSDNRRVFFVSDRNGISNVYAVDTSSGVITQVTDIDSGVSGITALSPAISSAMDAKTLAFSAYEDGGHHIYLIEAERLGGKPVASNVERLQASTLPPAARESMVASMLSDATTGLATSPGTVESYSSKLKLDAVSQPYITAGVDRFGGSIGGGIAFQFSDMLGNHHLYAQVSADTYGTGASELLKNTGAALFYLNTKKRWNWGVGVEQSPYVAGGYSAGQGVVNGQPAIVEQTIIQRQINQGITGVVSYPFSQTTRLEFGGGYMRTSYEQSIQTAVYSARTGGLISNDKETTDLVDPLNMPSVSTALVNDRSIFGATSPVAGTRSRVEMSPTFGDLNMTSALFDYRHYFMPVRFYTIAVRGLHYGRYGAGAQDPRLIPLYMGYPEFVRGYDVNTFEPGECESATVCSTYDRLVGSRMLVGNVEFRFPLLRPFRGVDSNVYGPVPVEVAFFLDGGVTWNKGQKPSFFNGSQKPVTSGGITFRANLMGFAVAQIDYARPFDRPGRGWIWGFSLTPGF